MSNSTSRREFLSGEAARAEMARAGLLAERASADSLQIVPSGGNTVRLGTRAMACDFAVIMNPGPSGQFAAASEALDLVQVLEDQMSVYRTHSELSQLNRRAASEPVLVESRLFDLLLRARQLCHETEHSFDPTSGPLIALWRQCRQQARIPTEAEIEECLSKIGIDHILFDEENCAIQFDGPGVEWNLGSIGKGYALDRSGEILNAAGIENWLIHGGHSSLLSRGEHNATGGWPVGIRNPLFPDERLGTLLLKNQALSTSGSGTQYFRHAGKRYGHILDPRTGWPVDGMLSVTVVAPTAAEADALSTAFFVAGVEKTRQYCDNHTDVGVLLVPSPQRGRGLEVINFRVPDDCWFPLA